VKLKITAREVLEGQEVPRGYGVAYVEPGGTSATCYPIPLNFIVRWSLLLWYALKIPRRTWWEQRFQKVHAAGYQQGHDNALAVYRPDGISIFTLQQVEQAVHSATADAYIQGCSDLLKELEARMDEKRNPPEEPIN
jgi:hypothetical protein